MRLPAIFYPKDIVKTSIRWKDYFFVVGIYFFCLILSHLCLNLITRALGYELRPWITSEEAYTVRFILGAALIGPVVEELVFRLPLILTKTNLILSFSFLIYILSTKYLIPYDYNFKNLAFLIICFAITSMILNLNGLSETVIDWLTKNYLLFFYSLLFVFAFIHILRYNEVLTWMIWLTPLITLPQLLLGYVASFFRLRYGVEYAILFHMINNAIPLAFLIYEMNR